MYDSVFQLEYNIHYKLLIGFVFDFMFCSGYMSLEYAMYGHLSDRADVYSFGIVILEIVSGRRNNTRPTDEEGLYLIHWVRICFFLVYFNF